MEYPESTLNILWNKLKYKCTISKCSVNASHREQCADHDLSELFSGMRSRGGVGQLPGNDRAASWQIAVFSEVGVDEVPNITLLQELVAATTKQQTAKS